MSNDPFSDVLRLTEARSIATAGFAAGGTWGIRIPAPRQIVFSAIAKGTCYLRLANEKKALRLDEGDVGLLPGRTAFSLSSRAGAPLTDIPLGDKRGGIAQIGRGAECIVLSGRVSLDPSSAALLTDALPSRVHVRASSPRAAGLRWLIEQLLAEQTSSLPGASVASEKIAELLFVQILRAHVASEESLPSGWLRAVGDERILRTLRLVHAEPSRAWTLGELAKAAGMSRTRFAVHFKATAGVPPLGYLAAWRMRLAQRALREEDTAVFQIAESLGYASESAFSHAFKRIVGSAPGSYRSAARERDAA